MNLLDAIPFKEYIPSCLTNFSKRSASNPNLETYFFRSIDQTIVLAIILRSDMRSAHVRVSAGIFLQGSEVLMALRSGHEKFMPLEWQFPGGEVLPHETFKQALRREIKEELGITVISSHLLSMEDYVFHSAFSTTISFYVIDGYEGKIEALENQELSWIDLNQIRALRIIEPNKKILEALRLDLMGLSPNSTWNQVWLSNSKEFSNQFVRRSRATKKVDALRSLSFRLQNGENIADIGCGTGEVSELIASQSNAIDCAIYCIDASRVALSKLQAKIPPESCLEIIIGSALNLPIPNAFFDKIITLGLAEHIEQPDALFGELKRVLKTNGELFITHSNVFSTYYLDRLVRQKLGRWPYGFQRNLSPHRFMSLVARYFRVEANLITLPGQDSASYKLIDRAVHSVWAGWGRTIYLRARRLP
jgi:8-oxo-dGTP diphosphatase